jgi:hypothetical protein
VDHDSCVRGIGVAFLGMPADMSRHAMAADALMVDTAMRPAPITVPARAFPSRFMYSPPYTWLMPGGPSPWDLRKFRPSLPELDGAVQRSADDVEPVTVRSPMRCLKIT